MFRHSRRSTSRVPVSVLRLLTAGSIIVSGRSRSSCSTPHGPSITCTRSIGPDSQPSSIIMDFVLIRVLDRFRKSCLPNSWGITIEGCFPHGTITTSSRTDMRRSRGEGNWSVDVRELLHVDMPWKTDRQLPFALSFRTADCHLWMGYFGGSVLGAQGLRGFHDLTTGKAAGNLEVGCVSSQLILRLLFPLFVSSFLTATIELHIWQILGIIPSLHKCPCRAI
ncbi:hypothetical protein QBC46DRAFT_434086 [Diplogelasinospora grovesii]|uniref:Uncharacterized protein n=1 Tax=Diplogelasinospora grovesii TaxID=303347 RepID=A0AAN6S5H5_9PEZI|nr:hypothetical protein QBC46DRAFT_434086 [Diplogelasinospora grovesii]